MILKNVSEARSVVQEFVIICRLADDTEVKNKRPMFCDVQLAATCLYLRPLFQRAILTHKVGQTGLAFGA